MSLTAWAVLALIVLGCLYVLALALLSVDPDNDDLEDWPGAVSDWEQPWADAGPVADTDHTAWMKSMTNPQTPDEIRRASIGAQRLRAAMHEQAQLEADAFLRELTDGGGER